MTKKVDRQSFEKAGQNLWSDTVSIKCKIHRFLKQQNSDMIIRTGQIFGLLFVVTNQRCLKRCFLIYQINGDFKNLP